MKRIAAGLGLVTSLFAMGAGAQDASAWEKSYDLRGQPTLVLTTGDASLTVRSCGDCRKVHVRIDVQNRNLSDYRLNESQDGDTIHFSLTEKATVGFHLGWHEGSSWVRVLVETPANLTLEAKTSDGSLSASGLHGDLSFTSHDGSQNLEDVSGSLKLHSWDGSVHLRNGSGTLESHGSDGSQKLSGTFRSVDVSSSDGSMTLELLPGSKLTAPSRIEGHDGSVTVTVPHDLAAELDVSAHDGSISSDLPLLVNGYNTRGGARHDLHGTLNGGGPLLTIHTGDGSVKLRAD